MAASNSGRHRHAATVMVLIGLAVASAVVFGLVLVNIELAQTSFGLSDVQSRVLDQQDRRQVLRFEVARAESPEQVARMAARLGMVTPPSQKFLQGPSALVAHRESAGTAAGYQLSAASARR